MQNPEAGVYAKIRTASWSSNLFISKKNILLERLTERG